MKCWSLFNDVLCPQDTVPIFSPQWAKLQKYLEGGFKANWANSRSSNHWLVKFIMSIYSGITLLPSPRGTRWHTVGLTEWTSTLKPDVNSKIIPGGLNTCVYSDINPVPVTEGNSMDIHSHRRLNEHQPSNLTWAVALNNWHLEDHFMKIGL